MLLQLEHGWVTLLGHDARVLASQLLHAADQIMPDPLEAIPLFCNASDGDFLCTLDGAHPGPHLAFGAGHQVRHAWR